MRRFVLGLVLVSVPVAVSAPAGAISFRAPAPRPAKPPASMPTGTAKARPPATAIGYTHDAQRVLVQARAAAGGAGWNFLRGWHETGRQDGVAYETWLDPLRYGLRAEIHAAGGVQVHGFNGLGAWTIAPGGEGAGTGDDGPVALARAEAFYGVYGFFFQGRFDAHGDYLGSRQQGARTFDVVEVKPWNAAARQLWFDRRTHLLARMVDRSGPRPLTIDLSDYRKVGPVTVAFRLETRTEGSAPQVRQIESLAFIPADRALFSLPRPSMP